MKKTHAVLIAAAAFTLGLGINNAAISNIATQKIATVDVNAVISKSAQVKNLKKEHQQNLDELQKWLNNAQADVNNQLTQESRDKLLKQYQEQFNKKKEAMIKNHQEQLKLIDKNISDTIATEAQLKGYDLVLTKGVVLYGGNDITLDIQKNVK